MHRRLYKYVEVESLDNEFIDEIKNEFERVGMNLDYDLEIDFPTDLPYDVFRPGEVSSQKQILLLDRNDRLREISEVSDIVRSISGIHRGKCHLYYPANKVETVMSLLSPSVALIFKR